VIGPDPNPEPDPSVSVVVATHRRRALLERTLGELLAHTAPAEVVVVDDGSGDGTAELLTARAAAQPRLRPAIQDNAGAMRARLAGAAQATGDVVLLLDDDVVPEPGVVAGHASHHAGRDDHVVVGYMPVAPAPPTPTSYPRDIYARFYEERCRAWEAAPETILSTLWAGHLSVRRARLLELRDRLEGAPGGYHGDVDLGLCLADAGLHGVFDRTLRSTHRYERTPTGYVADARSSGTSLAEVARRHPRAAPVPDRARLGLDGISAPARRLVLEADRAAWPSRALAAGIALTGRLHAFRVQRFLAGLVWRVEQRRAFAAWQEAAHA
jgi:hypothetical protein